MAVEKAAFDFFNPMAATAAAAKLERTLNTFQETFETFTTRQIRRKLKKKIGKIEIKFGPDEGIDALPVLVEHKAKSPK